MPSRKIYIVAGVILLSIVIFGSVVIWRMQVQDQNTNTNSQSKTSMSNQAENESQSTQKLSNGLIIEDIKIGTGKAIQKGDTVSIHYVGTLENGTKFDSSVDRGQKFTTQIGAGIVIKGWDLGIPDGKIGDETIVGMKEGGERKLTIPAALAYGDRPLPGIPAGSTLIFVVTQPQVIN
jgi:FKBP-type peptidyl-prolyl cis-trans isomerase